MKRAALAKTVAPKPIPCKNCGRLFVKNIGSNRVNCETCRPVRAQPSPLVELSTIKTLAAQALSESAPAPRKKRRGAVELATAKELEQLERSGTVSAEIALRLARDLDGDEISGSQASTLGAQLLKVMSEVRASAPRPPDALDALSERIWAKRQAAQ